VQEERDSAPAVILVDGMLGSQASRFASGKDRSEWTDRCEFIGDEPFFRVFGHRAPFRVNRKSCRNATRADFAQILQSTMT